MSKVACLAALILSCLITACASGWKIQSARQTCMTMCKDWDLEFAGIVGIGNQEPMKSEGATACVCQVAKTSSSPGGGAAASASLARPISPAEAAGAAHTATARFSSGPGYQPP